MVCMASTVLSNTRISGPSLEKQLQQQQQKLHPNDTNNHQHGSIESNNNNNNNSFGARQLSRRSSTCSNVSCKNSAKTHFMISSSSGAACEPTTTDTRNGGEPILSFSQKDAEEQHKTNEILQQEERKESSVELGTVNGGETQSAPVTPTINITADTGGGGELISKRTTFFLLALLCLANLCLAMNSSLIAPFFPAEVLNKGGTAFLSGLIISTFDGTRFFLAPVCGNYIYAIGPRFMLITGPVICACCSVLFGLNGMSPAGATFFTLAACLRIVSGAGTAMYTTTSIAVRPVLFKGHFSLAYSLLRSSVTLGVIIGPAIGSVFYALGGFGLPFWVLGGFAMCISIVQTRTIPDLTALERAHRRAADAVKKQSATSEGEEEGERKASFVSLFTNPAVAFCCLMYWSFGFLTTYYTTNISLHIQPLVGSVSNVGYIILIAGAAEICVSPFVGIALDRGIVPARLTVVIGYALCAIGLLAIGPTPLIPWLKTSLWLVIVGTVIYGLGIGFGFTAPYNLAVKAARAQRFPPTQQTFGLIAGGMSTAFTGGCFLGPLTGGATHDKLGFPWSATIVAGGLCCLMLMPIANSMVHVCRWHRQKRANKNCTLVI